MAEFVKPHFRNGTAADAALLHTLVGEMAAFLEMEDSLEATPEKLAEQLFGPRATAHVRIAEVEGNPAGYCVFYTTLSTFRAEPRLYLEDIFIRDEFRALGVGKAMMGMLAELAEQWQCYCIEWQAPENNERANRFYRSLEVPVITGWTYYRMSNTLQLAARKYKRLSGR